MLRYLQKNPQVQSSRSRWGNLDRFRYRLNPIKFVNSVVPSPCKTQPYNNTSYLTVKAAHSGNPGKLAAADITTLTYTLPPRKGVLNDIPQLMKDTANLFNGNKTRKIYDKGIRFPQKKITEKSF